jgi:hypothetical protein
VPRLAGQREDYLLKSLRGYEATAVAVMTPRWRMSSHRSRILILQPRALSPGPDKQSIDRRSSNFGTSAEVLGGLIKAS